MITNIQEKWYQMKPEDIADKFETDLKKGLSNELVFENRKKGGRNILKEKKQKNLFIKSYEHFKSPMNLVLFGAVLLTLFLGQFLDSIVIFLALFVNLIVGVFQEDKASKAFDKLNKAQKKKTVVMREGTQKVIPIEDLVLGDIVILNAGMYVPADIRLFKINELKANEAALTGEWMGVEKTTEISEEENMLWMGTSIASGYGSGIVVALAKDTELGKITENLSSYDGETPMRRKINNLVKFLALIVLISIVAVFILGILKGETYADMFLIVLALSIAVIPQGLPVATTAVLAVGMKEILKKGGLVKNLLASETLGNVSIILTDKTGTITEAKMELTEILSLSGSREDNSKILEMALLGSDAFVEKNREGKEVVQGRSLEIAIVQKGIKEGLSQELLLKEKERLDLFLFSSKNGFSASLNRENNKNNRVYINGRPEIIIEKSKYVFENGIKREITESEKEEFLKILNKKTNQGMRLTAQAYKDASWEKFSGEKIDDLVFLALLSFNDPIREGVKEALERTKEMGVRTVMLTGDNEGTARKIAEEVGIIEKGGKILLGSDVEKLNNQELETILGEVNVFARMKPEHKLRVSKTFKKIGNVTAMTGDGINDAPALRNASVGLAVESGTDVAKESADIILLENSFSVIVFAIEEGRRAIDNLKKIVSYLLSTSFAEVFVVGGALLLGFPLPILASQILWINIVEDGLMNFAFVFEPKEKYKQTKEEMRHNSEILNPFLKKMILLITLISGLFLVAFNYFLIKMEIPLDELRTLMFIALAIDSLFFALSLRSLHQPIWKINLFTNIFLITAVALSFLFIFVAIYVPFLQTLLHTVPLNLFDFFVVVALAIFNLVLIETVKYFIFLRKDKKIKRT